MSENIENRIQQLHENKKLDREIADELDIKITTVFDIRNKLGLEPNGKARASDEELYKAWHEEGLSLQEIASRFGYANISNISYRLRRVKEKPYAEKIKLSRVGDSPSRIVSIQGSEIEDAGFDPAEELHAKKIVEPGKIIFNLEVEKNE